MLFTSVQFLIFVFVALVLYYTLPKKCQWIVLLVANVYFYLQAGFYGAIFMAITMLTSYFAALIMDYYKIVGERIIKLSKVEVTRDEKKKIKADVKRKSKVILVIALLINFGALGVLKYSNLFITSFTNFSPVNFILPMGISFYTFQTMGYIVDVYRGSVTSEKNFFKYALFVSFFPQLVQGPISKFTMLSKTLYAEHDFSWDVIESGLMRIIWGYFKKMIIADRASVGLATLISDFTTYKGAYSLLGIAIYAVQLYADFTGGIDITIGVAELFGITLPENFKQPFFSKSLAEYWRRWHITLCTWFKDYVFYPISTSKRVIHQGKWLKEHVSEGLGKRFPMYLATLTVWFVTGMWHGAKWNFIVWGLLNGIIMLLSQELSGVYKKVDSKLGLKKTKIYGLFEIIRTTILVAVLQMLDYHKNIADAARMFVSIFTSANYGQVFGGGLFNIGLSVYDYVVLLVGIIVIYIVSYLGRNESLRVRLKSKPYAVRFILCLAMLVCILIFGSYGIGYEQSQFIYNQF